jgi:hypothetical protein
MASGNFGFTLERHEEIPRRRFEIATYLSPASFMFTIRLFSVRPWLVTWTKEGLV